MAYFMVVPLTCWLCALIATPGKPRIGDEVQELVYLHLVGRQQRLALLACACTMLALFLLFVAFTQQARSDAPDTAQPVTVGLPVGGPQACYPGDGRCLP